MSIFDGRRLTVSALELNVDRLRTGYYSDKYFANVVSVLAGAAAEGYGFAGRSPRSLPLDPSGASIGDIEVEAQYFNRREPRALVAGVDAALAILRCAAGGYDAHGAFTGRWEQLEVEAVQDGVFTHYSGDPMQVQPVLKVRGRYRDFALLETAMLGVMTRASRVATNTYDVLAAAGSKQVLFFPARFDLPEVQMLDGYAYWIAVQRHNLDTGLNVAPLVSTDAQGALWGVRGGGTVPHALIACFLGDTAEAMTAYARILPPDVPRIALVDFDNDVVGASLAVLAAFWEQYRAALEQGDTDGQRRWRLDGVRLDTSANLRDVSLEPDGPRGVNPELVRVVRAALDNAWEAWHVPAQLADAARTFCHAVKIVVSGGFSQQRIREYEAAGVPVDAYGVGSRALQNDGPTNTDYSMDVVRVRVGGQWVDIPKTGRQPCGNPDLRPVDLREVE